MSALKTLQQVQRETNLLRRAVIEGFTFSENTLYSIVVEDAMHFLLDNVEPASEEQVQWQDGRRSYRYDDGMGFDILVTGEFPVEGEVDRVVDTVGSVVRLMA
jgi:hypothetical protein